MLLFSQNREVVIDAENAAIVVGRDENDVTAIFADAENQTLLGEYADRDEAIEVLHDMVERYEEDAIVFYFPKSKGSTEMGGFA